jgi:hypothetical protein
MLAGDDQCGLQGALQRGRPNRRHGPAPQPESAGRSLSPANVAQSESGEPAIDHAVWVAHLCVPDEVDQVGDGETIPPTRPVNPPRRRLSPGSALGLPLYNASS